MVMVCFIYLYGLNGFFMIFVQKANGLASLAQYKKGSIESVAAAKSNFVQAHSY